MTFLDSATTIGNLRAVGDGTPYYFIETREQKDALDRFLRELGRAHPSGHPLRDATQPPPLSRRAR